MTATSYSVTGMTCVHCVRAVTDELTRIPGVAGVKVDLVPAGASVVTVSSDAPVPEEAISAALDEAGDYRIASKPSGGSR